MAEHPELAFHWPNLYLACAGCNRKLPNTSIPAGDCLDPCDASAPPPEHLTYDDEFIRAKAGSTRGHRTIQKYRLDRAELDLKRGRQLRLFLKAVIGIQSAMLAEQRTSMNDDEKDLLRRFRQPDQPFSLMFAVYTRDLAL